MPRKLEKALTTRGVQTAKPGMWADGGNLYLQVSEAKNGGFNRSWVFRFGVPGPDGKMMDMEFKGTATDGYDNVKKKFVSSWIDNMGTGIVISEGTYDTATKTFTYYAETEMMPGMKTKIRQVLKIADNDHHTLEFYEDRGGQEVRTMEIKYARSGGSR